MLLLAAMANGFSSLPGDSIHQCLGNYPAEDFLVTVPTDNDGLYPVARCYKRCFEYRESQSRMASEHGLPPLRLSRDLPRARCSPATHACPLTLAQHVHGGLLQRGHEDEA